MIRKSIFLIVGLLTALISYSFSETNDEYAFTVKLYGGYNMWFFASSPYGLTSQEIKDINLAGLSFGGDLLFGDLYSFQFGIEGTYLPIFSALISGNPSAITLIPVSADIVFNRRIFYTDIGIGMAFLDASTTVNSIYTNFTAPKPSVFFKIGLGLNFKLSDFFGIDTGLSFYLPFGDFGLLGGRTSAYLNMILFCQLNIRLGICFYL